MEDKEWVLENVEEICADTRDVDEVCMALEHSTIFATEIIQNLTKTILDLQQELSKANDKLKKIEEYINFYGIGPDPTVYVKPILKIIKGDE